MKRRGCCSLLGLGKNSMGSNSVSQWKMFRFFNVVFQTGLCPALAPRTTHTHMSTLAQAQRRAFHPSLLGSGDGCVLCPTPAEQNRSEVGLWLTPSQRHPCLFGNRTPSLAALSTPEAGWATEEGNWTPNFCLCASPRQAILSVTFLPRYVSMKWRWPRHCHCWTYSVAGVELSGLDCAVPSKTWPQRQLSVGRKGTDAQI